MVLDPKLEPGEISVETRHARNGKGGAKTYLIVSLDALEDILYREEALIANGDATRLLMTLVSEADRAFPTEESADAVAYYERECDNLPDDEE